jgi:DNA-binding transcriptional regulator YdaS (Cro superfamily)
MKLSEYVRQMPRGKGTALAQALKVSQPTVSDWSTGKKPVPVERCAQLERATGGVVTRKDLRPDDWQEIWPELAGDTPITTTTEPATAGDHHG